VCPGREFQVWAAATGKARLPTVASLTGGTTRRLAQSSSTREINSRGERPQIPWCVVMEDSECCGTVAWPLSHGEVQGRGATGRWPITGERQRARRGLMKRHACKVEISIMIMMMELNELRLAWLLWVMRYYKELRDVEHYELGVCELWHYEERRSYAMRSIRTYVLWRGVVWWRCMELLMITVHKHVYTTTTCCYIATNQWRRDPQRVWTNS